jgi:hypothetical protein
LGDGVVIVLGLPKSNQVQKRECAEEGERGKQRGVVERPGFIGIWSFELPAMAEIGEKSGQPGGYLVELEEGKEGGGGGLLIGVGYRRNGRGIKGI